MDVSFLTQLEAPQLDFYNSSYTPWKVKRSAGLIACWYYALLCTLRGCFLPQFLVSTMHSIYSWKALDVFFPMHFESPHLEFCSSSYLCLKKAQSGCQEQRLWQRWWANFGHQRCLLSFFSTLPVGDECDFSGDPLAKPSPNTPIISTASSSTTPLLLLPFL